jgi:hypothetical protein
MSIATGFAAELNESNFGADKAPARAKFSMPANIALHQFHQAKAKDKQSRRGIKKLIRPENAQFLSDHIPRPGETVHCVVRGDFVFADLIPVLLQGKPANIIAASTLGLSKNNATALRGLMDSGQCRRLLVLVSHYFSQVDKNGLFAEIQLILGSCVSIARTHCKVVLIDTGESAFVVAGSANLRSSDTAEQFSVWNDRELLQWHLAWMEEMSQTQ